MLCPKCGFITFDQLDACPKCRKDWTDISEKIRGTATSVETACFLGKVIREQQETPEESVPVDMPIEEETPLEGLEESAGEEFDVTLDELPAIDLSGIEEEGSEVEESGDSIEGGLALNIDKTDSESLDADDPAPLPPATDSSPGGRGLDLNEIDLSDLVTQEEEPAAVQQGSLDLDLSALEIEGNSQSDTDSFDLELSDDEDDLNLSLDLEPESTNSSVKKQEAAIPDLGLSLDD